MERLTEYLPCMHTLLATCLVIVLLPMQLGENKVYYLNILEIWNSVLNRKLIIWRRIVYKAELIQVIGICFKRWNTGNATMHYRPDLHKVILEFSQAVA